MMRSAFDRTCASDGLGSKVWELVASGTMPCSRMRSPPMLRARELMGATVVATSSLSGSPVSSSCQPSAGADGRADAPGTGPRPAMRRRARRRAIARGARHDGRDMASSGALVDRGRYYNICNNVRSPLARPILRAMSATGSPTPPSPSGGRPAEPLGGRPGPAACPRPALDTPAAAARGRPVADRRPRHRRRARRALPPEGPVDHPVDGLPDARRAGGAGPRASRARARRSRGVPRAAGDRARPPPLLAAAARAGTSGRAEAAGLSAVLQDGRGFAMDLTHLTVSGLCAACARVRAVTMIPDASRPDDGLGYGCR